MPPPQEPNVSVPTIGESSRLRRRPAVVLRAPTNAVAIYCGAEQVITAENICEADYDAYRPWNVSILPEPERTPPSASPSPRKRETRSNGCGAPVHGSVVMMRQGACWYGAREELARTVIPLERGYFPRDMVMALDLRDEGCEVASCGCRVSGLGCAVCGNPLGAVQCYCAAHSARPDFTPAPASYSFSPSAVTPAPNATTSEQQNVTTSDRPTWDSQIQIADTLTLTPTPASPRALPFIPPLASPPTPTPASPTTFPSSPSTPGYISFIPPTTSYVPMQPRSMTMYTQPTTMARTTAPPTHPPWYGSELATAIMTGAGARLRESESESAERSTVQRAASSSSIVATNANANTRITASNGPAADGRTPRPRPPPHRRRTLRRPGSVERYLASSSGSGSGSGGEADAAPSTSAYTSTYTSTPASAPSTSPSTYTSASGAWFPHPFPQPLPAPQQQASALDAPSSSFQADLQRNVMQILRNGEGDADAGAAAGGGGLPVWGYSGTRRGPGSIAPSWAASGAGADADEEGWEPYPMFSRLLDSGAPGEGVRGFEIGDTPMPFFHTFPDLTTTPTTTTIATTSTTAAPDVYPDRDTLREIRTQLPPVRPPPRPSMFLSTAAAVGGFTAFSADAEGGRESDTRSVYPVPPGAFDAWHSTPDPPPRWGPGTGFVTNTAIDVRGVEMQIQMMDAQRLAAQDESPEARAMRILAEQRAAGGAMRGVMGGMGIGSDNALALRSLPPPAANTGTGTGTSRGAPSGMWAEQVLSSARASASAVPPASAPRLPGRGAPAVPILPRVRVREAQARDARTELLISARTALAEERARLAELHGRLSALAAAAAERERPTSSSSSALVSDVSPASSASASESISTALASSSSSTPAPTASAPLVADIRALVQAQAALLSRVSGLIDGMGARVAGLEGIVATGGSVETVVARARDTLERAGTGTAAGAGPARLADALDTGMGMEELRAMQAEARRLVAEARRAAAALTAGVSQGQEQDSTSASQAGTRSGAAPPADEDDKRPRPRTSRRIFFER